MSDESVATVALAGTAPQLARARTWGFYLALIGALLLLAVPMAPFLVIPLAWPFLGEQLGIHWLHDVGVGTMLWLMLAGLLAQLRHPRRNVGAMQQTLVVMLVLVGATAIARPATLPSPLLLPFGLAFVAAALHPARREIGRLRRHVDAPGVALAAAAAGPAVLYAQQQLRLDSSLLPVMVHGGHWTTMGSLAVTIVALALLGANRPVGWRVPAWSAGAAAVLFGVASLSLQAQASSVRPMWSVLAIAWGVAFVLLGKVRVRAGAGRFRDPPPPE